MVHLSHVSQCVTVRGQHWRTSHVYNIGSGNTAYDCVNYSNGGLNLFMLVEVRSLNI